jgi:hypothetical protein
MSSGLDDPPVALGQKVFICYRREDTAAHAGRLYDSMVARFGERNVFMDVEIEPGVDFVERITSVVSGCLVLIVVMGREWATVEGPDGGARIADPGDFVRLEVETALRRPEVTPIPVLVSGARMPRPEQLPEPLRPLTRRNALELSDARWRYDVGRLQTALEDLIGELTATRDRAAPPEPEPVPEAPAAPAEPAGWRLAAEGAALAAVGAAVARELAQPLGKACKDLVVNLAGDKDPGQLAALVTRRGFTWALVAALVAVWLIRTRRGSLRRPVLTGLLVGALAGILGGLIYGVPAELPGTDLIDRDPSQAHFIDAASVAVTGAILGALIGAAWRPPRLGIAALCAGLAGGLIQLPLLLPISGDPPLGVSVLYMAITAAAIVGGALAALIAADRSAQPAAPE